MKYKIPKPSSPTQPPVNNAVDIINNGEVWRIPFDPANTDYQTFKSQILSDEAQLEDADGNLMTAEEAKAFVATLP